MEQKEYIAVGRFGRPRGVDGEIYIIPLTDFPDRFLEMESVFVSRPGGWEEYKIETSEIVGGRPIMKLKTIDTPESAAAMANCELAITREQLRPLAQDQYYVFDLVGCDVIDAATGEQIGAIADVQRYPANDVYLISDAAGNKWICAAVAAFVRSVDIKARRVVIDKAGLLAGENGAG